MIDLLHMPLYSDCSWTAYHSRKLRIIILKSFITLLSIKQSTITSTQTPKQMIIFAQIISKTPKILYHMDFFASM